MQEKLLKLSSPQRNINVNADADELKMQQPKLKGGLKMTTNLPLKCITLSETAHFVQ